MKLKRVSPLDWSVLQVVQRLGAPHQHRLAEQVGRQRSTVNGAVQRLLAAGWLSRVGQTVSGRGRPAILLAVNRDAGCFAGVEIAARDLHCAVVAADGTLLDHTASRLGDDLSVAAVLDHADLHLRGLLSRVGFDVDRLMGIWAGVNGAVDAQGVVVTCASLGWHREPLRTMLLQRYHCDVLVEGASAATNAAAEALLGVGRQVSSFVYYHAGRGISARLMRQGQALVGQTQRAGEFGHVVVEPGGTRCPCGNRGCLEAEASGPAIVAAIRRLPRGSLPDALRQLVKPSSGTSAEEIVSAAFGRVSRPAGGPLGALRQRVTQYLSMGAAMAVAAYDPELLVLGGYLFEQNAALRNGVCRGLRRMVLDWEDRNLEVIQGQVLMRDRAVGGAAKVCQRFWSNPRGMLTTESVAARVGGTRIGDEP
jgi:predicted NBD/HSP70 family sugar kinase